MKTEDELQNIVEPAGVNDAVRATCFRKVIHRQSVAIDLFTESASDLSMIMFCMPVVFLLLVARDGRVPCFSMAGKSGVKWLPWTAICVFVFASMGVAVLGRAVSAILAGLMWVAAYPLEDGQAPLAYSIVYNGAYLVPELTICMALAVAMGDRIYKQMK